MDNKPQETKQVENKKESVTITDKNFEKYEAQLDQVLTEKVKGNWLTELQAKQIMSNFRNDKDYEPVKQYLEESKE